ncbi:ABC transporter permease [Candidatus Pacearchaeota archaeon]|nr:ABC transporter permease [Candidatus Pacearchaeota archaeon]
MKQYISLSISNLRRRKLRAWLTMLGIFIGIAAVVSLISLGEGLKTAVTGQFGSLSADVLTVQNAGTGFGPPGSTVIKKLTSHDLNLIEKVQGISEVIPRLIRIARIEYNKAVNFNYVASMPENQKQIDLIYNSLDLRTQDGRLLKEGDKGKVVLGSSFTGNSFDKKIRVGSALNIQGKDFEVVGILKPASSFQVNLAILMMEDDMKSLLGIGDEIDIIMIKTDNVEVTEQVAARIEQKLRKDRNEKIGEEDFSVLTPLQAISSINTVLDVINIVVSGIAAISLLVGGIGIMNTMYTSVLERTKEIGAMKAIGARNSDILKIFLIESGLLGLVGGIIGAGIGLGFAFLVSFIANSAFQSSIINVSVSYTLLIGAVSFSFLIGIFAGLLPAYQASKLNPVEALRA